MRLDELKKGGSDQRGREILDILWSTKDYVIFRHSSGISPHFSDVAETAKQQRAYYASIGPHLSKVNALRSVTVWRAESIDREIARAVYQSLEGDITNAAETLEGVRTRLQNLINLQGRLQYQISCLATVALFAMLCLVVRALASDQASLLSPARLASVAMFGALGGFLSISIGLKKLTIDPDADWRINAIAGASRIVIAVIASIFVYLMIAAKLALTSLNLLDSDAGIYAISMAAGFSEKLVPNLLRGLSIGDAEKDADGGDAAPRPSERKTRKSKQSGET
jgi:hypothetical protein